MIGLDTNVLLRVLIEDGDPQSAAARDFLAAECSAADPAFINTVVLVEVVWVLVRRYAYGKAEVVRTIEALLAAPAIAFANEELVRSALKLYSRQSIGFSDAVIGEINRAASCSVTATFDRKAAKTDCFELVR